MIVKREEMLARVQTLDILEREERQTLVDYLDPMNTGQIAFEDFKAALLTFLASSGDVHSSFSEDEFNTVMARIKSKFEARGMKVETAFVEYDVDGSGTLQ